MSKGYILVENMVKELGGSTQEQKSKEATVLQGKSLVDVFKETMGQKTKEFVPPGDLAAGFEQRLAGLANKGNSLAEAMLGQVQKSRKVFSLKQRYGGV